MPPTGTATIGAVTAIVNPLEVRDLGAYQFGVRVDVKHDHGRVPHMLASTIGVAVRDAFLDYARQAAEADAGKID